MRKITTESKRKFSLLNAMHGEDWESVIEADTEAVVSHAKTIGSFFHKSKEELEVKLLLTGSDKDEMFPKGHYENSLQISAVEHIWLGRIFLSTAAILQ